jgi:hypothetical protein
VPTAASNIFSIASLHDHNLALRADGHVAYQRFKPRGAWASLDGVTNPQWSFLGLGPLFDYAVAVRTKSLDCGIIGSIKVRLRNGVCGVSDLEKFAPEWTFPE